MRTKQMISRAMNDNYPGKNGMAIEGLYIQNFFLFLFFQIPTIQLSPSPQFSSKSLPQTPAPHTSPPSPTGQQPPSRPNRVRLKHSHELLPCPHSRCICVIVVYLRLGRDCGTRGSVGGKRGRSRKGDWDGDSGYGVWGVKK